MYLSPPVDCHDGGIVAYTAGSGPNAELANRMLVKAAEGFFGRIKVEAFYPEH